MGLAIAFSRTATAAPSLAFMVDAAVDAAPPDCIDVRTVTPPALPDDNADDRPGIQAAIALAQTAGQPHAICLPGGQYDIMTKTLGSTASFDLSNALSSGIGTVDITFIGDGPHTKLLLNNASNSTPWILFQLGNGAKRIEFRDMTIDGSSGGTSTSTTFFQIGTGDATGVGYVSLRGVSLVKSPGDAVQIRGSASTPNVAGVSIRGSRFVGNAGHGVEILEGTQSVEIASSYFQACQTPPCSVGEDIKSTYVTTPTATIPIDGVSIAGNVFYRTSSSPMSISLLGYANAPNQHASIRGNVLLSGRIQVDAFGQVVIESNIVSGGTQTTADPELAIHNSTGFTIHGNQLIRTTATPGSVLLTDSTGTGAQKASIDGNTLVQGSAATIVQLTWLDSARVTGNMLVFTNPSSSNSFAGIAYGPASTIAGHVGITGNLVVGDANGSNHLSTAISVGPGDSILGALVIDGNVSHGTTYGVTFASVQSASVTPVVSNNLFEGVTAGNDITGFSTQIPAVQIGGNGGNSTSPVQLTGNGAPCTTIAAPIGSIYLRRDPGTGPALWVKESGTGTSGWAKKCAGCSGC